MLRRWFVSRQRTGIGLEGPHKRWEKAALTPRPSLTADDLSHQVIHSNGRRSPGSRSGKARASLRSGTTRSGGWTPTTWAQVDAGVLQRPFRAPLRPRKGRGTLIGTFGFVAGRSRCPPEVG